jgi:DNA-binding NtrC family response regulator
MAPRRLQKVDEKLRSGYLRDGLEELRRVYDPKQPGDRVLMAELLIETEGQEQIRTLVGDLIERPGVDPSVRSRACNTLAMALRRENRLSEAVSLHERAVHYASNCRDGSLLCRAQVLLLTLKFDLFGPSSMGTLPADVLTSAISAGDPLLPPLIHCYFAGLEGRRGALDLARKHLDLAMHRIGNVENPYLEGLICNNSTTLAAVSADPIGALNYAERTLQLTKRSGDRFTQISAVNNLCHISLMLGRVIDAERYLAVAEGLVRNEPFLKMCLYDSRAQIQLLSGRLDECETTLSALAAFLDDGDISQQSYAALEIASTRIRLLRRRNRFEEALSVARTCAAVSRERGIPLLEATFCIHSADALIDLGWIDEATRTIGQAAKATSRLSSDSLTVRAELERVRGRALAKLGELDAARRRFDLSIRMHEATGHGVARDEAIRCKNVEAIGQSTGDASRLPEVRTGLSDVEIASSLLTMSSRPDLLGVVAHELLATSGTVARVALLATGDPSTNLICHHNWSNATDLAGAVNTLEASDSNMTSISLGAFRGRAFWLLVDPLDDIGGASRLVAIETIIRAAAGQGEIRRERLERTSVWPTETVTDTGEAVQLMGSARMREVYREVKKVAPSDLTILLTGETGVGKEILAREIHRLSARAQRDFRPLVCAGIASSVLESQLFGYRKGSFTGAMVDFPGVIRGAQGGTLFLDEIGELTHDLQIKLLRFLDSKEVHPLGELEPSKVDVRIIAATNANLQLFVEEKKFREDLLYRLGVATFHIPPLRDRREEIPSLVQRFLTRYAQQNHRPVPKVSDEALEHLLLYRWPGNVRQLRNEMERLAGIIEPGGTIRVGDLKPEIVSPSMRHAQSTAALAANQTVVCTDQPLHKAIDQLESVMITRALSGHTGNLEAAARALGLTRKGLYHKRQRLGLL